MNQGSKANYSGRKLEREVELFLIGCGVESLKYSDYMDGMNNIVLKQPPYRSIYNNNSRLDFLLKLHGKDDIWIECKQQNVAGSVDEKLPYIMENAIHSLINGKVIIILEGNGFKPGAVEYMKSRSKEIKHKDIKVFNLFEFKEWFKTFIRGGL